jgi:hypothetical protein
MMSKTGKRENVTNNHYKNKETKHNISILEYQKGKGKVVPLQA